MSLTISWDAGFFSCCSVKLYKLVEYVNQEKELPRSTDESELFTLYKPEQYQHQDITDHFFTKKPACPIDYSGSYTDPISLTLEQFQPYSAIRFNVLKPFVDHYFSRSQTILDLQSILLEKYSIDVCLDCHQESPQANLVIADCASTYSPFGCHLRQPRTPEFLQP